MTTFSVVTPSFHQVGWLRLAVASVADQTGKIAVEHIVQDAGSTDGTADFLAANPQIDSAMESDEGMYDALNRGFRRTTGEILCWLNCDEQYLPGALSRVAEFFKARPEVEMLFASWVVVDTEGNYLCSRKTLPPLKAHTQVCHLSPFSCATFFRRSVLEERGLFFDKNWKTLGDAEWMIRCLRAGVKMAAIPNFTSVFTDTGKNIGLAESNEIERTRLRESAPWWQRNTAPWIAAHHRFRRWRGGVYQQEPFDYVIYTQNNPIRRSVFHVANPVTHWKSRFTLLR